MIFDQLKTFQTMFKQTAEMKSLPVEHDSRRKCFILFGGTDETVRLELLKFWEYNHSDFVSVFLKRFTLFSYRPPTLQILEEKVTLGERTPYGPASISSVKPEYLLGEFRVVSRTPLSPTCMGMKSNGDGQTQL